MEIHENKDLKTTTDFVVAIKVVLSYVYPDKTKSKTAYNEIEKRDNLQFYIFTHFDYDVLN